MILILATTWLYVQFSSVSGIIETLASSSHDYEHHQQNFEDIQSIGFNLNDELGPSFLLKHSDDVNEPIDITDSTHVTDGSTTTVTRKHHHRDPKKILNVEFDAGGDLKLVSNKDRISDDIEDIDSTTNIHPAHNNNDHDYHKVNDSTVSKTNDPVVQDHAKVKKTSSSAELDGRTTTIETLGDGEEVNNTDAEVNKQGVNTDAEVNIKQGDTSTESTENIGNTDPLAAPLVSHKNSNYPRGVIKPEVHFQADGCPKDISKTWHCIKTDSGGTSGPSVCKSIVKKVDDKPHWNPEEKCCCPKVRYDLEQQKLDCHGHQGVVKYADLEKTCGEYSMEDEAKVAEDKAANRKNDDDDKDDGDKTDADSINNDPKKNYIIDHGGEKDENCMASSANMIHQGKNPVHKNPEDVGESTSGTDSSWHHGGKNNKERDPMSVKGVTYGHCIRTEDGGGGGTTKKSPCVKKDKCCCTTGHHAPVYPANDESMENSYWDCRDGVITFKEYSERCGVSGR